MRSDSLLDVAISIEAIELILWVHTINTSSFTGHSLQEVVPYTGRYRYFHYL